MNAVYAPGTVAVATVRGVPGVRVFRYDSALSDNDCRWDSAVRVRGAIVHEDHLVTNVRPLVDIDPENRAQVERLVVAHCRAYCCDPAPLQPEEVAIMQTALREFANPKPPKPEEPQGLGAVVEDEAGARWTRARNQEHGFNWRAEWGGQWKQFADIDAVRVLSEGVTQ